MFVQAITTKNIIKYLLVGLITATLIVGLSNNYKPAKAQTVGTIEWIRQFGSAALDMAQGVDSDGNAYAAGWTLGTFPGQISSGGTDAFVRKYDANGNELWTRQFGTSGFEFASAMSVDASGVYVAGRTDGTFPSQISSGGTDVFIRKYDTNGNELWTRQFGTSGFDAASAVSVDSSGVYVAGGTGGALPGQTSSGGQDAFVRKYDTNGNELWTRQFGSPVNDPCLGGCSDQIAGISVNASSVYVAGSTNGTLPGQIKPSASHLFDAFVRKYDANGNEIWTRQFGAPDNGTNANTVSVDASGVYVAGRTFGTFTGQTKASGRGGFDAFVRKYDANGNEIWTKQFGVAFIPSPAAGGVEAFGISVDASGVYVAGDVFGTLQGQTSSGDHDAFLVKFTLDPLVPDTTPPDTAITSVTDQLGLAVANGETTDLPLDITFNFTGTDNVGVTGFECSLDGAAFSTCASPKTYNSPALGSHTFQVRARDAANNVDSTPASHAWTVDDDKINPAVDGKPTKMPTALGGCADDKTSPAYTSNYTNCFNLEDSPTGGGKTFGESQTLKGLGIVDATDPLKGLTLTSLIANSKFKGCSSGFLVTPNPILTITCTSIEAIAGATNVGDSTIESNQVEPNILVSLPPSQTVTIDDSVSQRVITPPSNTKNVKIEVPGPNFVYIVQVQPGSNVNFTTSGVSSIDVAVIGGAEILLRNDRTLNKALVTLKNITVQLTTDPLNSNIFSIKILDKAIDGFADLHAEQPNAIGALENTWKINIPIFNFLRLNLGKECFSPCSMELTNLDSVPLKAYASFGQNGDLWGPGLRQLDPLASMTFLPGN